MKDHIVKTLLPSETVWRKLPQNLLFEDQELFRGSVNYTTFNCCLKYFSNVRVSPDSIIYKNGRLVKDTLAAADQISYYRFRHQLKKRLTSRSVKLSNAKYLLATDNWSSGHFHWFMEVLPKLFCLADMASDFVLLLPDTAYIRNIGFESLSILGLNFADVLWMREDEFYSIENLYYITPISVSGQVSETIMKKLNAKFCIPGRIPKNRFYISRENAKYRKILNENELFSILREYGFEMILGEELSLIEQVELFSNCKIILGIHGAGLTNCIFMPPGGTLIELRKREINNGYWHLSDSVGHDYIYFNGLPDSDKSLIGNGCNLSIPIVEFEKTVLKNI